MTGSIWDHIPPAVMAAVIAGLLGLFSTLLGLFWRIHNRERDKRNLDSSAQWARINELHQEVTVAKQDLAVLRERVRALPDAEFIHEKLAAMEEKLERKLDALGARIERYIQAIPCRVGSEACPPRH